MKKKMLAETRMDCQFVINIAFHPFLRFILFRDISWFSFAFWMLKLVMALLWKWEDLAENTFFTQSFYIVTLVLNQV